MKQIFLSLAIIAISLLASCKDETAALPDNLVNFETNTIGIDETEASKTVTIQLSRAAEEATTLTVSLNAINTIYGTDFTTEPVAESGTISLPITQGATSATFAINKVEGIYFDGDESIEFTLALGDESLVLGEQNKLTVAFASIVSEGSNMTLQGGEGGSSAINSVFVDFSNNMQTSVARKSWDLGFYCADDFRVILNHTVGAAAIAIDKTDLTQVTAEDTVTLNLTVSTSNTNAFNIIDDVDGDMTKTVFGDISSTDADNKVFIINRGTSGSTAARAWKKVRVLRTATGYTLQYANITDATFQTIAIDKDASYNFKYISFDSGAVSVQPAKAKWDFMWTGAIYKTTSGTTLVPYYFSDQVLINQLAGVTAAEVLTSTVSYADYAESNIAATTFSDARSTIGANWRVTQGTVGVKTDRFYVIKDGAGNVYKIRFTSFHASDGGVRGYPTLEYALVKKA